jgi:hypothetical protein
MARVTEEIAAPDAAEMEFESESGYIGVDAFGVRYGVRGASTSGIGVRGFSEIATGVLGQSELGLGGDFGGKSAPIRLRPAEGTEGPPKTGNHQVGEMFVDGKGNLYFCAQPNVWRQIVMV